MELFLGENYPAKALKIPPGVAHGCRAIGGVSHLFYVTSNTYDTGEEGRISHDDPEIGYDWTAAPEHQVAAPRAVRSAREREIACIPRGVGNVPRAALVCPMAPASSLVPSPCRRQPPGQRGATVSAGHFVYARSHAAHALGGAAPAPVTPPAPLTRRELGGAALLIALLVTLYLGPALFTGRIVSPADVLFGGPPWQAQRPAGWTHAGNPLLADSAVYFEPALAYAAQRLHAGSLPLWNPENMLGAPFVGNMQSAVFDPLNWPYFLWPGPATLNLRVWLRLWIAALGMYVLARQTVRVGRAAAALATITFLPERVSHRLAAVPAGRRRHLAAVAVVGDRAAGRAAGAAPGRGAGGVRGAEPVRRPPGNGLPRRARHGAIPALRGQPDAARGRARRRRAGGAVGRRLRAGGDAGGRPVAAFRRVFHAERGAGRAVRPNWPGFSLPSCSPGRW